MNLQLTPDEIPNDAPQLEIPEAKVTVYGDEQGNTVKTPDDGLRDAPKVISDKWQYVKTIPEKDGILTHVYTTITHKIPNDDSQVNIPELVDSHVKNAYSDFMSQNRDTTDKPLQPNQLIDFRLNQVYKLCGDTTNYGKVKHMYKPLIDEAVENDYNSTKIAELFIKSLYLLDDDLDNYFKQTMSEIDMIIAQSI